MAANMVRDLHNALKRWPIISTTVWMHSMVDLYWIRNPGKPWKVFVSNRVKKMAEITGRQGSAGSIVQQRRIWQTWEAEELEFTRWRPEGGLQVLNGY